MDGQVLGALGVLSPFLLFGLYGCARAAAHAYWMSRLLRGRETALGRCTKVRYKHHQRLKGSYLASAVFEFTTGDGRQVRFRERYPRISAMPDVETPLRVGDVYQVSYLPGRPRQATIERMHALRPLRRVAPELAFFVLYTGVAVFIVVSVLRGL